MASWRAYLSRSVLLLALLAVASPAQGTPAKPPTEQAGKQAQQPERPADEAALFAMFGELRGMSASYTEKKHLSLLAVPLTSSGRLHFLVDAPPAGERRGKAHLVREVLKPEQSRLTITEAELRMTDGDSTEVIDLRQSDRVRLFVTSLLRIFQGDREALQRHYRVSYVLDPEHRRRWRLELQPKKAPLDKILKRLTLFGEGQAVARIELLEPSGDRTVTTIDEVDPERTFTAEQKREIFGIGKGKAPARGK